MLYLEKINQLIDLKTIVKEITMYIAIWHNNLLFSSKRIMSKHKNFAGSLSFYKWSKNNPMCKNGFYYNKHNDTIVCGLVLPFFCFSISKW